jgi:hypothetical protein
MLKWSIVITLLCPIGYARASEERAQGKHTLADFYPNQMIFAEPKQSTAEVSMVPRQPEDHQHNTELLRQRDKSGVPAIVTGVGVVTAASMATVCDSIFLMSLFAAIFLPTAASEGFPTQTKCTN